MFNEKFLWLLLLLLLWCESRRFFYFRFLRARVLALCGWLCPGKTTLSRNRYACSNP